MYDDKAWKRFCARMAEAHRALKECENEVDQMRRLAAEEIRRITNKSQKGRNENAGNS